MLGKEEIEELELDLLLKAVNEVHHYDFSNYSRAHVKRRINHFRELKKLDSISQIQHLVLHDPEIFNELLDELSIKVTEMFRNPGFFVSLREHVLPLLETYPFPKIWVAGCATGEEVYSLAILLKEAGLYDRTTIYATDFNPEALRVAKEGIYSIDRIKEYTQNYQKSGGHNSFSDYYTAYGQYVQLDESLKKNIVFKFHNLDKDDVFAKVNLVICRNVMIYFNKDLQKKVVDLFSRSLTSGGFLALGMKESLLFSGKRDEYDVVDVKYKIYKRKLSLSR